MIKGLKYIILAANIAFFAVMAMVLPLGFEENDDVAMASGVPGDGHVTQAFTASVVGESTLEMRVRIFGHCPHAADGELWPHILTVYAILADGSKWYYTTDVGDQIHNVIIDPTNHKEEIRIELDDLPVPKPIVNGSGFQPTIDGWQSINIEVTMDN